MPDLLGLSELETDLVPEILPASASFSVDTSADLLRALVSRAKNITPTREVVPGTSHALLEAIPASLGTVGHLRINASDGEQTISVSSDEVKVRVPGQVLIPPKRVWDILSIVPDPTVSLIVVGSTLLIRSGRARWSVEVPDGDFPSSLFDPTEAKTSQFPVPGFLRALTAVRKATSTTSARVSLMQVQLKDGMLLACDGGRLHQAVAPGLPTDINTTIPVKVVDELIRALDGVEMASLSYGDDSLMVEVGGDLIVAQRLILAFPAVDQILLNARITNHQKLIVDRVELEEAIKRVRINADPEIAVVSLNIVQGVRSGDDRVLEVRSVDRAHNTAWEAVECVWEGKPGRSVSFNHHHLTDLLSVCSSETLVIRLGEDSKATKQPLLIEDEEAQVVGVVQQVTQHW